MAIWMDMTNSLQTWSGGVVGIVRAELEIAKNMHADNPEVRFVKYVGSGFEEIPASDLQWLWDCESVGDAYLKKTSRAQTAGTSGSALAFQAKDYPGLVNAYQFSDSRLQRLLWGLQLYANTLPGVLRTLTKGIINLLSKPLTKFSIAYVSRKRRREQARLAKSASSGNGSAAKFHHPFSDGDTVFSCGWIYSGKENGFEQVLQDVSGLNLIYLIYDIILVRENTRQFYPSSLSTDFKRYLDWASMHCTAIFYGGRTAMEDTQDYQKKNHLPCPNGYPVYFGSDILRINPDAQEDFPAYAEKVGITGEFIMAVGSLDERKNYSTLYRAITILADRSEADCPQLVIVGKGDACQDLLDTMSRDPRTEDRILLVTPSDEELNMLYRHARFVVLASAWEGWSLTLPEALGYHKLILAADVKPLREAGQDYAVYVDPYDPFAWADQIAYYLSHPAEVAAVEKRLCAEYRQITWKDCGIQISGLLRQLSQAKQESAQPALYMDITLATLSAMYNGKITGILRSELMLAKQLYRQYPGVRFFAINNVFGYVPLDVSALRDLLTGEQLDADFDACRSNITQAIFRASAPQDPTQAGLAEKMKCKQDAYWFFVSLFPAAKQEKLIAYGKRKKAKMLGDIPASDASDPQPAVPYDVPFRKGDVVFTAGTGSGKETHARLLATREKYGYAYCPIVYDYTPILLPQVHKEETIEHYIPFLDFTSKMSDFIFYGGETARQDGIAYQKKLGLPIPPSCAVRFGSDIKQADTDRGEDAEEREREEDAVLKRLGIKGDFIMAVGTMEARKNHETLYRAYLRMLERGEEIPQMVFCGHPGWKTGDFLATLSRDERVKGKILLLTPTDEELDILYRHCEFTVLASLYEGWSLTLPESYWYRKFCLCCDTPALKETAGELAEYIHGWDEKKWAERICYYHSHPDVLRACEQRIEEKWHAISWEECAETILRKLKEMMNHDTGSENGKQNSIL